jgi:predicted metalloprotease with PDZ domain
VTRVLRDTPAHEAGLNVDDEIVAIDGQRVIADQLAATLQAYRPGERVSVLVARRRALRTIEVPLDREPADRWRLEIRPDATPAHRERLARWTGA